MFEMPVFVEAEFTPQSCFQENKLGFAGIGKKADFSIEIVRCLPIDECLPAF